MTQAQIPLTSFEPRPKSEAAVRAFTRLLRASASTTRLLSALPQRRQPPKTVPPLRRPEVRARLGLA